MKPNIKTLLKYHRNELFALLLIFAGGTLGMLGMIQRLPFVLGVIGIIILATALFYFCLALSSENVYKDYYKDCYEIEHGAIEEEIRRSMVYHRYQEAVLGRYESACRDLGLVDEQKDWLLDLLMAEKNKVDKELSQQGGGHI